jgi:hypothetical protein
MRLGRNRDILDEIGGFVYGGQHNGLVQQPLGSSD